MRAIYIIIFLTCINSISIANNIDTLRILNDLHEIIDTKYSRNSVNIETLNQVAEYIKSEFKKTTDRIEFQEYAVESKI